MNNYNEEIREKELLKLKESNYFDETTLNEIREDLKLINEEDIRKNQNTIEKNTHSIIEKIPYERLKNDFLTLNLSLE
ncbi:hypothetical protein T190115A13A_60215 [Tenacibaculum sp. 190524A02b]|uniref:Uncharacterized protein n=1 Tax=Tenacibaculum vairaonense TaxID=3137860 RepID=A0ABP1FCX2_9FLAO